jgi:hypothetical protein
MSDTTARSTDVRRYFDLGHQGDADVTQIERMLRLSPAERLRRHQHWQQYWRSSLMDPEFIDQVTARLADDQVEFLIVGGVCATLHGSPRQTLDLDVCYRRTTENIRRLAAALKPLNPRPRGFPPDLPFVFDERTIQLGSNFTLVVGGDDLDLLGEMSAIGGYEEVITRAVDMTLPNGRPVKVLSLEDLIATKEAAGRPKDLLALVELRLILEVRRAAPKPDDA